MVHFIENIKQVFVISLISSALFFTGCWWSAREPQLIVVNVMDKDYFDDCHITGSVNIFFDDVAGKIKTLDKKNHYVFYCSNRACSSSEMNAKMLLDAGFTNVWDYAEAMSGWYQAGLPCEGAAQKSYLRDEDIDFGDEASDVPVITTQELYKKMKEFNLL